MKLKLKQNRASLRSTTRPVRPLFNVIAAEGCAAGIADTPDAQEDMADAPDICAAHAAGTPAEPVAGTCVAFVADIAA